MQQNKYFLGVLTLLIITTFSLQAQGILNFRKKNKLLVDFQLRPRAEYRNGYAFPLNKDEFSTGFIINRARLGFNYKTKGLSTKLSLQNVGVWGQNPVVNTNQNILVHEAWAKLVSKEGLYTQIGRQALHYDDGRLFSLSDWNHYGRTHDVLKFGYLNRGHDFQLFLAFNQDKVKSAGGTYYSGNGIPYKTMQGLYYKNNALRNFTPSFILVNLGYDEGSPITGVSELKYMQTFGTNLIYHDYNFKLHGIAYYQMGKTRSDLDISAYLLSISGKYNFDKKFSITLGTDYLSGEDANSPSANKSYNAFSVLYGGNHGRYGVMDNYITTPYAHNLNLGIWDKYFKLNYKPTQKLAFSAGYSHLSMAADMYNNNQLIDKNLGSEINFVFNYKAMKNVSISGGYAFMLPTDSVDLVKGGDHNRWQDWGFFSININPTIFKGKW